MSKTIPVQKMALHQPSLEEVAAVLQKALSQNFNKAQVKVVECPDLTQAPFDLADKGLGGKRSIADVGGPDYIKPFPQKDKIYTFSQVAQLCEQPPESFILGAGAGPNHVVGINCEMMCNAKLGGDGKCNKTTIAKIDGEDGRYILERETSGEFGILGNFYISEGKPGKVIEVKVSERSGSENFVECLHKALTTHYEEKPVGIGGTFLLKTGKANIHVMPDFSKEAVVTDEQTHQWLKFFEMDAPLIHVGEIVSADPQKLHLRQEHFHCYSDHGQGGHYHYDTTPSDASYLAYFNLAQAVFRLDIPSDRKYLF